MGVEKYVIYREEEIIGIKYDSWSGEIEIGGKKKCKKIVLAMAKEYLFVKGMKEKFVSNDSKFCVSGVCVQSLFRTGIERLKIDFDTNIAESLGRILS